MTRTIQRHWIVAGLILLLIVIDQVVKIWIKTHMYVGQEYHIFDWFRIYFVENRGMAYGVELGSKLLLTAFRIIAMAGLAVWLTRFVRQSRHYSLSFCCIIGLVLAGGIGNLIDSLLYGQLFTSSIGQVAQFVPTTAGAVGYAPWFEGHVVDMLYFPLFTTVLPEWFPIGGGSAYTFFSPIFNIADSCITVGVLALLICYPRTTTRALDRLWIYLRGKHRHASQRAK